MATKFGRFALMILVALVPTTVSANTIYFPQVVFGDGYSTTFVIMNNGTTAVSSTLTFYDQGGRPRTNFNVPVSIAAGTSTRVTLPNSGSLTVLWGELNAGSGSVQGVATFELRNAAGTLVTTAGVLGVEASNSVLIPVDVTANGSTGVAIANVTSSAAINVRLRLIGENGSQVGVSTDARIGPLGARGQVAAFVNELFTSVGSTFRGTLAVEAPTGSPANALAITALTVKESILSALPVIPGGTTAASGNTLFFPQVVFGGGYATTFVLMNTGGAAFSSRLNFYSQDGVNQASISQNINIPAGGSTRVTLPNTGPLTVVWGELGAGAVPIKGVAAFDLRSGSGTLQTTAGVLGLESGNTFLLPVDVTATGSTGIAISNVSSSNPVNVRLRLYGENGAEVAASAVALTGGADKNDLDDPRLNPLRPRGQLAAFVDQLFTGLGTSFRGALVIEAAAGSSPATLAATALTVKEGVLSALPVIPGGAGGSGSTGGGTGGTGGGGTGGGGTGGGGTGGGGTGGGGTTGSGSASECLNTSLYSSPATVRLEYNFSGSVTGTSISDFVHTPNQMFEGNSASEFSGTQTTTFTAPTTQSATTRSKSYSRLDGTDILSFGGTVDLTTPIAGTIKTVFTPPFRNRRYSLNAGESATQMYSVMVTQTFTGLPALPPTTSTVNHTVRYLGRESVTVPAGTFNACKFEESTGPTDPQTTWEAPNTGVMVRSISGSGASQAILELRSGTVNGSAVR